MFRIRFLALALAAAGVLGVCGSAMAAEVESGTAYCFTARDFSQEESLTGICVESLPQAAAGTVLLGSRVIRPGDILTAEQLEKLVFRPLGTREDVSAAITYLPIFTDRVEESATMTLSIRGKEDKPPVAQDLTMETYKNLPNQGCLKANDPEGEKMIYALVRPPKRGEVTMGEDGSFTYTPKKNKVGVDSFTFTAADPAGNVSREATVTIQILKPTDAKQYTDTLGRSCRFAAEWMRNTGLFVGETVGDAPCFRPDQTMSRGEFLTMLVKGLNLPRETGESLQTEAPEWLKPYLAAAIRSGLTAGLPAEETFRADEAITGGEAAVMLQNALDLPSAPAEADSSAPAWAASALSAMAAEGIELGAEEPLTRGEAAELMYEISRIAPEAPGLAVFRLRQ